MLAQWLEDLKLTNTPKHSVFAGRPFTTGSAIIPDKACESCPRVNEHPTCSCVAVVPPADNSHQRIAYKDLRTRDAVIHGLYRKAFSPPQDLRFEGAASIHFIDSATWEIVAVNNTLLTLRAPEGVNPAGYTIFEQALHPEENSQVNIANWGVIQPWDEIEFLAPSSQATRRRPRIVRILGIVADERIVYVDTDQNCTYCNVSGDISNPNPAAFYCRTLRQAGDPPKYAEIIERQPKFPGMCKHCKRDWSNSIWNDPLDAADGIAPDGVDYAADGRTWYCHRRFVTEAEVDEFDYTVTYYDVRPSGVAGFKAGCCNTQCDQYSKLTFADQTTVKDDLSSLTRDAWMSVHILAQQVQTTIPYEIWRVVGRPSIYSLMGGHDVVNPSLLTPNIWSPDWGCGFVADQSTVTGVDGTKFRALRGAIYDLDAPASNLSFGQGLPPGILPTKVSGWTTKTDPLGVPYDDDSDKTRGIRYHWHRCGTRITKDLCTRSGRGSAYWPKQVEEPVACGKISLTGNDWQYGDRWMAKCYPDGITVDGFPAGLLVQVKPLVQFDKPQFTVVSGTLANASVEDDLLRLEFTNGPHVWGRIIALQGGGTTAEFFSWSGGGNIVRSEPGYDVSCIAEPGTSIGSPVDLASIGDLLTITSGDYATGEPPETQRGWVVRRALSRAGSPADDWGPNATINSTIGDGVCAVPGHYTDGWGKNHDVLCINRDAWLESVLPDLLINQDELTIVRNRAISADGVSPVSCHVSDGVWSAITPDQYLWRAGTGQLWVHVQTVAAWRTISDQRCVRL